MKDQKNNVFGNRMSCFVCSKNSTSNAGQERFYVAVHQGASDLHINLTSRKCYKFLIIDNLKQSSPGLHPNFSPAGQRVLCLAGF